MSLDDAKFLLTDAKEQLEITQKFYEESINQKEISPVLRLKIKHFLEDIKSSLDYTAFSIFNTYSIDHIKMQLVDHQRQVCFPVKHTEKKFDTFILNVFPELNNKNPKIVEILKSVQPCFNNTTWYNDLNELVNKNKHRYLTPQHKKETTHIHYMKDVFGNTVQNCTFENVAVPVAYGDHAVDFTISNPDPFVNELRSTVWIDFLFSELGKSVIPTLSDIYYGAIKIINEIEECI